MDPESAGAERKIAAFVSKKNFIYCKTQQQQQKNFARVTVFVNESSAHLLLLTKKSHTHCCSINGIKGKLIKVQCLNLLSSAPHPQTKDWMSE